MDSKILTQLTLNFKEAKTRLNSYVDGHYDSIVKATIQHQSEFPKYDNLGHDYTTIEGCNGNYTKPTVSVSLEEGNIMVSYDKHLPHSKDAIIEFIDYYLPLKWYFEWCEREK